MSEMRPIKGGINLDGTQRYSCPICGLLWWEEKDIPDKCQCGADIEKEEEEKK